MSQYHVYQTEADYAFSGELVDSVSCNGEEKRINQNDREVLENLFEMFNLRKPEDFHGRSLSVSDVVEIVRKNQTRRYYCDRFGWMEITGFTQENTK